jgi:RimJ/RimL family protein N-acetyltransferase
VTERPTDMTVVGDRVLLRPWRRRDNDDDAIWQPQVDPLSHLWNVQAAQPDLPPAALWPSPGHLWAVCLRDGTLIGRLSLRGVDPLRRSARLGITLTPNNVGHGLGTEAMRIFLQHYFGPLGFEVMVLDVAAINRRAVRCYERLGFAFVGTEWRNVGRDAAALRLLQLPEFAEQRSHFRAALLQPGALELEFYEMELTAEQWQRSVSGEASPG